MRAYIAGPMTGIPEFNFPAFDEAAEGLRRRGWAIISPAELDRADGFNEIGCTGHEPLTEAQRQRFARNDIGALLNVEAIVLLPGWQQSTGAINESKIAAWLGLKGYEYVGGEHPTGVEPVALDGRWSGTPLPDITPIDMDHLLADRPNHRRELLLGAEALVNGDRNVAYGDPRADFQRTATMWSAYLGVEVAPHDVAALMALLKLSRIRWSPGKQDSWMDLAGYAACGWDCAAEVTP